MNLHLAKAIGSLIVLILVADLNAQPFPRIFNQAAHAVKIPLSKTQPVAAPASAVKNAFPAVTNAPKSTQDYLRNKDAILAELAHTAVYVHSYSVEADGTLTYLSANVAAKGQKIIVQQDYLNYKTVPDGTNVSKVGILFRVQAELVTKKANVNVNGLFAIGLAVNAGAAAGNLSVEIHGLSGEPVGSLIPLPSSVSEDSLQGAMQAIATLKSKIYDPKIYIIPQVLPEL
jgi:hypothetical protein